MGKEAKPANVELGKTENISTIKDLTPRIVGVEEAPAFLIDNKYLVRGYRKNFRNIKDILRSLFLPHNETWNIWTHFSASLVLAWVLCYLCTVYLPHDFVIVHLKELSFKKSSLKDSLSELKASIPHCTDTGYKGHDISFIGDTKDHHLCNYIGSIAKNEFSQGFSELHSSVVQHLETPQKDSLVHSILSAVRDL